MFYYLAYGSNLNLEEMKKRCPSAIVVGKTILKDYKLVNRRYLNVEKSIGDFVELGIFKIDNSDIRALDNYEDYPKLYSKKYLEVELNGKPIRALIYIMNNGYEIKAATKEYIDICLKGFADFNFNTSNLIKCFTEAK